MAEELLLTQRITEAVEQVYRRQPERAAAFVRKLDCYERWLRRLSIPDEHLALFPDKRRLAGQNLGWALMAVLGAPIALYGWLHRLIPYAVVRWAVSGFTQPGKHKAQTSTAAITAGIVAFAGFYGACIGLVHTWFGWPTSLWYALSLPLASLLAYYYLRELRRLAVSVRNTIVLLRAPAAAGHLLRLRSELVAEIEAVRAEGRET